MGNHNYSFTNHLPDNSNRLIFTLSNGKLFLNDQRKFGWIKLLPTPEVLNIKFIQELGPEPFDPKNQNEFLERIRRHNNTVIKAAMLDQ